MAKPLKILLLTVLIVEFLYIAAATFFLNGPLLRKLVGGTPEELKLDYDWGISVLPGLAYVKNINLRVQDESVQLYFKMDSVWVDVDLLRLFRKEFHTRKISGDGLDFRIRFKQEKAVRRELASAVPPIPGLTNLVKTPESQPPNDQVPFRVRLSNVFVKNVRQLWIQGYRFNGDADVRGNFFLFPGGREVALPPSTFTVRSGKVHWGESVVLGNVRATLGAHIHPVQPKSAPGVKLFEFVDAKIDLQGELTDPSFMNYYLRGEKWLGLTEVSGSLAINTELERGRFKDGSKLSLTAEKLKTKIFRQEVVGKGAVNWNVAKQEGTLEVRLAEFKMRHEETATVGISGRDLRVTLKSPDLFLLRPFSRLAMDFNLPSAKIETLAFANSFLPKGSGVNILGGTGDLSVALSVHTDPKIPDKGAIKLATQGAELRLEKTAVTGNLRADIPLNSGKLLNGSLDITGATVKLSQVAESDLDDNWWANLTLTQGILRLGDDRLVKGNLALKGRDAEPILDIYLRAKGEGMPGIAKKLLVFKNLEASVDVVADEKSLEFSKIRATGESTVLRGSLSQRGEDRKGLFLLEYGPLAAGLELKGENTAIRLQDATAWYFDKQSLSE